MKGPASTMPGGNNAHSPLWRKHFPIDTAEDTSHTRREFIGGLAIAGGAMACGQTALNTFAPASVSDSKTATFPPLVLNRKFGDLKDGEALLFHYPDHKSPCLLVRLADDFVAFSQKCTHLACPVIPEVQAGRFHCPCHKGAFDIRTGQPLAGPPRTALPRVRIERGEDGTLTASGIERV
jgi:nitrite reductase/ring-hydroxylating ferredoxin subunit